MTWSNIVQIRLGYEITYHPPRPAPMLLMLHIHPSRAPDLVVPDDLTISPAVDLNTYQDRFGNRVSRILAPAGPISFSADAIVNDSGLPDPVRPDAMQHEVQDLPDDTLLYLLGSRYCETDLLSPIAWTLFGGAPLGWGRVQAICDFVHNHISFGYQHARPTKSAWEGYHEGTGVCRDFAHLALTLCRCMGIPARYCTGYMGDIGIPPEPMPMDFSGWFEAYLSGQWYTFDARHVVPRIGRVLMATGRDAADVALSTSFGRMNLAKFFVVSDEVTA